MNIAYTTQLWREGDQVIAHAMPLDVASSGASADEARKALDEAVRLFLNTAAEHGTLEQVLEDDGSVKAGHSWQSPPWLAVFVSGDRKAAIAPMSGKGLQDLWSSRLTARFRFSSFATI